MDFVIVPKGPADVARAAGRSDAEVEAIRGIIELESLYGGLPWRSRVDSILAELAALVLPSLAAGNRTQVIEFLEFAQLAVFRGPLNRVSESDDRAYLQDKWKATVASFDLGPRMSSLMIAPPGANPVGLVADFQPHRFDITARLDGGQILPVFHE